MLCKNKSRKTTRSLWLRQHTATLLIVLFTQRNQDTRATIIPSWMDVTRWSYYSNCLRMICPRHSIPSDIDVLVKQQNNMVSKVSETPEYHKYLIFRRVSP